MLLERSAPKVWLHDEEKEMKKQIGLVLVTGLLAAGCRPLGLPVPLKPLETTTTPATTPATASGPTTTVNIDGVSDASPPPALDLDLSELDDLLTELDTVLSDVDGALEEGEEK